MSAVSPPPTNSTPSHSTAPSTKRKYLDEEADFYADQEDNWKKQKPAPQDALSAWTREPREAGHGMDWESCQDGEQGYRQYEVSDSVRESCDCAGFKQSTVVNDHSNHHMHGKQSPHEPSWSMFQPKQNRRQSARQLLEARRDIVKLWRDSSVMKLQGPSGV